LAKNIAGRGRRYLPTSGFQQAAGVLLNDRQLQLIGLYLADGSFNGKTLTIYQEATQPWNKEIVSILDGAGVQWSRSQRRNANGALMNMYCIGRGSDYYWSHDEIDELETMLAQDRSYREIGQAIGRSTVA